MEKRSTHAKNKKMIRIQTIEIEDYFGIGRFSWTLDPFVNILGGKNGSGKSTLFNFCHDLLSQEEVEDAKASLFSNVFRKATIRFSNGWTLTWPSADSEAASVLGSVPYVTHKISIIRDETGEAKPFADLKSQLNVQIIKSFEQYPADAVPYLQRTKSAEFDSETMLDIKIEDQINKRNSLFSQSVGEITGSSTDAGQALNEYLLRHKRIFLSLSHFLQGYDGPIDGQFVFSKNGETFGYQRLSMGEKQILLLLLMVSNTQEAPCIFLMDEPDLSMHIDWKEILVSELHNLNPNMQIILSTHAPSVITGWHDKVKEVSQLIEA